MPWSQKDVKRHSKKAAEDKQARRVWVKVANNAAKHYGKKDDSDAKGKAIATANKVAGKVAKSGTKKNPKESLLFRDPNYGALGLVFDEGSFVAYDHGLNEEDFESILIILESASDGQGQFLADGGCYFKGSDHPMAVSSNIRRTMALRGYTSDSLSERAILRVTMGEAIAPILPGKRAYEPDDDFDRSLRQDVGAIVDKLSESGKTMSPTVRYFPQDGTEDSYGRPLPFAIVRGFAKGDQIEVMESLLGALSDKPVVRATVGESEGGIVPFEFALAPSDELFEAMTDGAFPIVPAFDYKIHNNVRRAGIVLTSSIEEDELADIEEAARLHDAVIGIESDKTGRKLVCYLPSVSESCERDMAFQERVNWLCDVLEPWGAELDHVGESVDESEIAIIGGSGCSDPTPAAIDAETVAELEGWIDGCRPLVRRKELIRERLIKTKSAGGYRLDLAGSAFRKLVDFAAADYSRKTKTGIRFKENEREHLAMKLAHEFDREFLSKTG